MCQFENQLITLTIGLKKPELNKMHILIYSSKNLYTEACAIYTFKTKRELCFQREIVSSKEREIKHWTTVLDEFGHGCGRFN